MTILRQPAAWAGSLGHFSVNYGYYFMLTWLPSYLVNARGFNVADMAKIGALVYCIHAVSSTLAGVTVDRLFRRGLSTRRVLKRTIRTGQFYLAFMVSAAVLLLAAMAYGALIPRIEPVKWADDGRELAARV